MSGATSQIEQIPIATPPYPSTGYVWFVTIVLLLIYTSSYIDRSMISLLVQPIRADLHVSDTQLSLLQGFAFALFYTVLGFPLGRLADRTRRTRMIGAGVTLWSIMTVACGLARSFGQLFAARIGVGIGEATLSPAAYSMITDLVPRNRLAGMLSVYNIGIPLGGGLALVIGGTVVRAMGGTTIDIPGLGALQAWQVAFLVAGFPGLLLGILLMATVREPVRRGVISQQRSLPIKDLWIYLKQHGGAYASIMTFSGGMGVITFGYGFWIPTTLIRNFNWNLSEVGQTYGPISLICGAVASLLAGWFANRWARRGCADAAYRMMFLIAAALWPFLIIAPLIQDKTLALVAYGVLAFFMNGWFGCAAAAFQSITPNQFRGQVTAIYFFVGSMIGLGLGPTLVAVITNYGFGYDGAVKYSEALVGGITMPLVGLAYVFGRHSYRRTLAETAAWSDRVRS